MQHPGALLSPADSGYGNGELMIPVEYAHASYLSSRSSLAAIISLLRSCTNALKSGTRKGRREVRRLCFSERDVHLRLTVLLSLEAVRSHVRWCAGWAGVGEDEAIELLGRAKSADPKQLDKHLAFRSYLNAKDVWSHILRFLS
jgi:hypothetical protein